MYSAKHFYTVLALFMCCCRPCVASAPEDLVEQGRYIFYAAGCDCCHSSIQPLAGGRLVETPFGAFYSPNITPDSEHGIGDWTEEDFFRALTEGISPTGEHYYPAFPYTSYTRMTASDKSALWAYVKSQPAFATEDRSHDLSWFVFSRKLMGPWKQGRFTPGIYTDDPTKSDAWNRGAYLVTALGHCGECHTPRGLLGGPQDNFYLAGSRHGLGGSRVPNITPDPHTGIGNWSHQDLVTFLETGQRPDGRYTQGAMAEVLATSVMSLTEYDRDSLATYLRSIPAVKHDVYSPLDPFEDDADEY